MVEVCRVWFDLPNPQLPAPALVLPIDNTLWLHMDIVGAAGRNNIHVGKTAFQRLGNGTLIDYSTSNVPPDPNQEANSLYPGTAMIFPLGHNIQAGDTVIAENKCRAKLDLIGATRSAKQIRFRLLQRDGSVYYGGTTPNTPMDNVCIHMTRFNSCCSHSAGTNLCGIVSMGRATNLIAFITPTVSATITTSVLL